MQNNIRRIFYNEFPIWDRNDKIVCNEIFSYGKKLKYDYAMFWDYLTIEILWNLWKARNDEKFMGSKRALTESSKRLTLFKIVV